VKEARGKGENERMREFAVGWDRGICEKKFSRNIGIVDRRKRAPAICDSRRKGRRGWVRSRRIELARQARERERERERKRERERERKAQASSIMQRAVT